MLQYFWLEVLKKLAPSRNLLTELNLGNKIKPNSITTIDRLAVLPSKIAKIVINSNKFILDCLTELY